MPKWCPNCLGCQRSSMQHNFWFEHSIQRKLCFHSGNACSYTVLEFCEYPTKIDFIGLYLDF